MGYLKLETFPIVGTALAQEGTYWTPSENRTTQYSGLIYLARQACWPLHNFFYRPVYSRKLNIKIVAIYLWLSVCAEISRLNILLNIRFHVQTHEDGR